MATYRVLDFVAEMCLLLTFSPMVFLTTKDFLAEFCFLQEECLMYGLLPCWNYKTRVKIK
jgi:hypothetical protein